MNKLAVVIPAYKAKYLEEALNSLAAQTDKSFTLYVGDDCSKEEIQSISASFEDKLDIRYHRFNENLGGKDLVAQWNRCCSLVGGEEWIWLFSDDDIADPECVETFYDTLTSTDEFYDVYRFDTVTINQHGDVVNVSPENPVKEDYHSLTYHLLRGERGNSMPDHIFRKKRLKSLGGFINFPFAQAADFASSIKFANPHGLYTMKGPKVRWRYSGDNISSTAHRIKEHAIFGHLAFIRWIESEFEINLHEKNHTPNHNLSQKLLIDNLTRTITTHYRGIPSNGFGRVVKEIAGIFDWSYIHAVYFCTRINLKIYYRNKKRSFLNRVGS